MRGSQKYQVKMVMQQLEAKGESRHAGKNEARAEGAKGSHEIAQRTGVHSYNHERGIKSTLNAVLDFQRANYGKADIEHITPDVLGAFFADRIGNVSASTIKIDCARLSKAEGGLKSLFGHDPNWYSTLQEVKGISRDVSPRVEPPSRYQSQDNRANINANITNEKCQFANRIAQEAGLRVKEVCNIRDNYTDRHGNWHGLRGIHADPLTGQEKGYIDVKGKGGKWRTVAIEVETYKELEKRLSESPNNSFSVSTRTYSYNYSAAAERAGVETQGPHDDRHSWYQDRIAELVEAGVDFQQACDIGDHELGHERSMYDIYGR